MCVQCGDGKDGQQLLFCDCGTAYHTYCLRPALKAVPVGDWRCPSCVKCERCSTRKPGRGGWRVDYRFCDECGRLHEERGYCNVCSEDCRTEDVIPMVCCDICSFWVHNNCDGISERGLDYITSRGDKFVYHCPGTAIALGVLFRTGMRLIPS